MSFPVFGFATGTPGKMATSHLTFDSEMQVVKLVLLGAPSVGKTSIIRQFVCNEFQEPYIPTGQKTVYHPAVIINDHLYEVKIIDCPVIPYFPVNSLYEWTEFRGYGLRNATAYILVYDVSSDESFQYIKNLRDQIIESRNMHDVPIFVVGNKQDLASSDGRGLTRKEVANLVRKQWKCGYIECSAKFNWHVVMLFKELMKTIDYIDYGHKPTSMRVQDALRRNRCVIL
ncbi:ras-like protein family member 10B [Lineus longissimus]|uniref:ras-like protein family member 10B n=1 Tax=Lineus longissimus TaxID=88925 RepID=UPI00315DE856